MKYALVFLLCGFLSWTVVAQTPPTSTQLRKSLKDLVEQYDKEKGVDGFVLTKGFEMTAMKLMLGKEFGKEFLSGVDMIVMIEYSQASPAVVERLYKQVDALAAGMDQVELGKEVTQDNYMRNYFMENDKGQMTDMLFLAEDKSVKCLMYFGGILEGESKSDKKR